MDGSSRNTTVGNIIPLGNVEAGNGENGIDVAGTASRFTTFNSFGGLFAFGGAAPNGNDGLLITATGGNQTVRTDVFSGNSNNGIEIGGNASGITVDPVIAGLDTRHELTADGRRLADRRHSPRQDRSAATCRRSFRRTHFQEMWATGSRSSDTHT